MGILTEDMQRVVREQRLGFHATVGADGTPNLSPKGTTDVWDDDHLWFADICSPQTVANMRRGRASRSTSSTLRAQGLPVQGPGRRPRPRHGTFDEGVERLRAAVRRCATASTPSW